MIVHLFIVKSHLQQTEEELKARLAMMEEEMGYLRTLFKMKIRRSYEKDKIIEENLKQAVAARKLAEAQLKKFEEDNGNGK
jgi:transcriptional antiterminator